MMRKQKMKKLNPVRQITILLIISILCTISIFCGILPARANTDEIYLQWEGNDPEVGGYLTITSFPSVLEVGKTYKITATFSLEKLDYADAVEFGKIEWFLHASDWNYTIGYSSLDANLTKHNENSTISHWGMSENPTTGGGTLDAFATIRLHNSTDPDKAVQTIKISPSIKLTLKVETRLRMRSNTFHGEQGHAIALNGTLRSVQGGATIPVNNETISAFINPKINFVLNDPNGNQINVSTIADMNGNFIYEFTPNATGTWYGTASYDGSSYFFPSTSNMMIIRVRYQFSWPLLLAGISLLLLIFVPPFLKWRNKVYKWKMETRALEYAP